MSIGRLGARLLIGGLFIGHGTQKLFGWFGGPGRAGTEGMMESLEMRPAKVHATPLAASAITGVMTTAIRKVHLPNGPWAANGGWEYNAVLIAAVTALAETGPGDLSLDHALGTERTGPAWALAALATGVATSFLTVAVARRGRPGVTSTPGRTAAPAAPEDTAGDPTTAGA
jgi:putative oxidoreductase